MQHISYIYIFNTQNTFLLHWETMVLRTLTETNKNEKDNFIFQNNLISELQYFVAIFKRNLSKKASKINFTVIQKHQEIFN